MGFRNLVIASGVSLISRDSQLKILNGLGVSIPIEDISSIILENQQISISLYALQQLVDHDVTVYICDEHHLPCAVLLPYNQHYVNSSVMQLQDSLSVPQIKQVWKQIVVTKINNQARCLSLKEDSIGYQHLSELAKTVASGDIHNVEATAARYYFKRLFDEKFSRSNEDKRNSALNYGYAIMRGLVARLLTGYGFQVVKGLHHANKYNAFNLADDFMEPLRPIVDLFVATHMTSEDAFSTTLKRELVDLLQVDVLSGGQYHSLNYGTERMIQSFLRICQKEVKTLIIPELVELKQHSYE